MASKMLSDVAPKRADGKYLFQISCQMRSALCKTEKKSFDL